MKVLQLLPPATVPGRLAAYTFLDEELLALQETGVEVFVLSPDAPADTRIGGVRVLAMPPASSRERARVLRFWARHREMVPRVRNPAQLRFAAHVLRIEQFAADAVRRHGIDVIHSHFGWPGGLGGVLAASDAGVPLVASFRGSDLIHMPGIYPGLRQEDFYEAALGRLLRHADRTTYVSDFMRALGLALGAPPERAVSVHKGVDTQAFLPATDREALKRELGIEGRLVLSVCGLRKEKGVDSVLRGMARIDPATGVRLLVCGQGEDLEQLRALSGHLAVADRVTFQGVVSRPEIRKYFAACDVFILGSIVEASGNVLLEAMASGRPVVCTDAGGPPEYVQDGVTGFVVPPGNARAIAEKIGLLLEDTALADALGRQGRARMIEQFAYDRMIGKITGLYASVGRG